MPAHRFRMVGTHPAPLMTNPVNINVRIKVFRYKPFRLCQYGAVLRYDIMPAEHQILGGFPFPAAAIYITAHQLGGRRLDQHPAIGILPYRFAGCRQINQHRSPGHSGSMKLLVRRMASRPPERFRRLHKDKKQLCVDAGRSARKGRWRGSCCSAGSRCPN